MVRWTRPLNRPLQRAFGWGDLCVAAAERAALSPISACNRAHPLSPSAPFFVTNPMSDAERLERLGREFGPTPARASEEDFAALCLFFFGGPVHGAASRKALVFKLFTESAGLIERQDEGDRATAAEKVTKRSTQPPPGPASARSSLRPLPSVQLPSSLRRDARPSIRRPGTVATLALRSAAAS